MNLILFKNRRIESIAPTLVCILTIEHGENELAKKSINNVIFTQNAHNDAINANSNTTGGLQFTTERAVLRKLRH